MKARKAGGMEEEGGRKRKRKSEAEANPQIAGQEVEKVAWLKCLGAGLGTDGGAQKVLSIRLDEASKIAKRAGKLPLPQEKKERIYASVVIPKAIYGVEVQGPEKKWLSQLTAAIERGLAGRDRRGRCAAISLSLVRKGHLVDPPVAVHYRRVMTWMALMKDSERCRAHMQAAAHVFPCPSTSGPVHLLDGTLEAMEWQRTGPWSIRIPDDHTDETETGDGRGKEVDLRTLDDLKELGHLAREALRLWRWRNIDRKNLEGIGEGVDRNATLRLLDVGRGRGDARGERNGAPDVSLSAYERGVLRHIMADAVLPQTRLHQRKMQPSATCRYCGKEDEDHLTGRSFSGSLPSPLGIKVTLASRTPSGQKPVSSTSLSTTTKPSRIAFGRAVISRMRQPSTPQDVCTLFFLATRRSRSAVIGFRLHGCCVIKSLYSWKKGANSGSLFSAYMRSTGSQLLLTSASTSAKFAVSRPSAPVTNDNPAGAFFFTQANDSFPRGSRSSR
ncbi:hypothetical protein DIPPA_33534 [Diplonema papillatum]|nr:hypothetical protein DIPPA_33534 [Diplonema papillatum]